MISRREFLKRAGVIGASTAFEVPVLKRFRPPQKKSNQNISFDHEYPFPYDSDYFEASERVVFLNSERASAKQADFWGPAGYTKLTITKSSVKIDYIRSAINHPYTNIPKSSAIGDIVQSILI